MLVVVVVVVRKGVHGRLGAGFGVGGSLRGYRLLLMLFSLFLSLSLSLKICDLLFVAIVLLGSVVLVVSTNQQHNGRSGEMFLHQKTVWKCELIEHRGELRI